MYKLPSKAVNDGDRIRIEKYDDQLLFYHALTNELLCKHKVVCGVGNIVTLKDERTTEPTIEEVLLKDFANSEFGVKFIKRMREQKTRYVYPQCRKLMSIRKFYSDKKIIEGMKYCVDKDICSVFKLCSWLVMDMGEKLAKKYLPKHTFRHYKDRAEEIRKEVMNK